MNKTLLSAAISVAISTLSLSANAALNTGTVLELDPGVQDCLFGGTYPDDCNYDLAGVVSGSYFSIDTNGNGIHTSQERVATTAGTDGGIAIGVIQDASGSHGGSIDGTEITGIDIFEFFSNTGMHFTTTPITVVNDNGFTKDLDFSGWRASWNGIPEINFGGGFQDCGTSSDGLCLDSRLIGYDTDGDGIMDISGSGASGIPIYQNTDISGTYNNGTGLATITCSNSLCRPGSTFTIHYEAIVPRADASGFGGLFYSLDFVGHVAPVAGQLRRH